MKLNKIKKGDIVGRKSYGKDIIFIVERIIQNKNDNERIKLSKEAYKIIKNKTSLI